MANGSSFSKDRLVGAGWVFEVAGKDDGAAVLDFAADGTVTGADDGFGQKWEFGDNVLRIHRGAEVVWEFFPFQEIDGLQTLIGAHLSGTDRGGVGFLKEQPKATLAPVALELTKELLVGKIWSFGEKGKGPWSSTFQFTANGKIAGYENQHEKFWHLDDGQLQVFAHNGQLSWIFELQPPVGSVIELTGEYRLGSDFTGIGALTHKLEPIKTTGEDTELFDNQAARNAAGQAEIAVLVLCAAAPKIIDAVLENFDDQRFHFFLHVDAKLDIGGYAKEMKNAGKATFLQERVKVYWGGFSMIEAELTLAKAALAFPNIQKMILISDDTAPLVGPAKTYEALAAQADRITCVPNGRPRLWYSDFFFADSNFSSFRMMAMDHRQFLPSDSVMIRRMEALREKGKKDIQTLYFGRQWWALSRATVAKIFEFIETDQHFVESFRFSLFPDETFFPTVFRTCFPEAKTLDIPTYADYGRDPHPWIFRNSQEILGTKFSENDLFVRKIAGDKPEIILELKGKWQ